MRKLLVILTVPFFLSFSFTARAASAADVDQALQKAKDFLYSQQKNGTWEQVPARQSSAERMDNDTGGDQWGGLTAVCTYALLASGESPQEPKLKPAIDFLKKADIIGVYALGMRAQVWLFLPPSVETKSLAKRDFQKLMEIMKKDPRDRGLYGYTVSSKPTSMSRTQYGLLGTWACAQMGIEVPAGYWKTVEDAWIKRQDGSGGWRYQEGHFPGTSDPWPFTPHMTAAGVASLYITQDYLHSAATCSGNPTNPAIDKGMAWLVGNFDKVASDEKYSRDYPYSTLYAIERVGVASGFKYFGNIHWYQKGTDYLIRTQRKNGSWYGGKSFIPDLADTSNGMLFLSRGRAPVVINKLQYTLEGKDGNWNQRPRDVANVTRWVGKSIERDLNWQITNLDAASNDLNDAPILYISGNQQLSFTPEQKAKLKLFCEQGGLIFGHSDCSTTAFTSSFRKLMSEIFPYEMRELPKDHIIYTGQQFPREKWRMKPPVLGLSNGVRELALLISQNDFGKSWQQNSPGPEEPWQMMANVTSYVSEKQGFRRKGESYLVMPDAKIKADKTIKIARLSYSGVWDPEPGGWRRLGAILHNTKKIDLQIEPAKLGDDLKDAKLAHLTGTSAIQITDDQRAALKKWIDAGGTLVIDAAGGSTDFAKAIEAELDKLYPGGLKPIAPEHALFTAGGEKAPTITYRPFAQRTVGTTKSPRLQGIEQNGRLAIIYSREDLSAALVGESMDGIIGYTPDTATALMTRIILYTAK
ncbi:MAG TPA: DUF4159 domain-containing protein [Tepidisphaeraceae bacterium]|nr:DUF4159 domain-containing protein [Tepidisphaeraceae bacterium]